jgi:hypothetical protein
VSWGSADLFSAPRLLGSALLATISTALIYPGVVAVYMQLREIKAA